MDGFLRPLMEQCASRPTTMAIMMADHTRDILTSMRMFDVIIYAVVLEQEKPEFIKHLHFHEKRIGLYMVDECLFRKKLLVDSDADLIHLLNNGEVVFDRDRYIESLKKEFFATDREMKVGLEFAELIRIYTEAKFFFNNGQYLDAYNLLVRSFHHLAKLSIIDSDVQGGQALWTQVKYCEPEILKLFEELATSEEPIEKRLELLFLANDFLIHSKTPKGAEHFLKVLSERPVWNYDMIIQHSQIQHYGSNVGILLDYLIEKDLVTPIQVESNFEGIYECCYQIKKVVDRNNES